MTDTRHDLWVWLSGVGAGAIAWWLGWPWAYQTFALVLVLDVLTGLLAGGKHGELDSDVSFRGMRKKGMEICLVGFASWIGTNPSQPLPLGEMAAMGFVITEGISVLENAGRLGINVTWMEPYIKRLGPPPGGNP
jgi:phage-related holin